MNENNAVNEMSINVNPFALAELVAHKKIDWNKYDDDAQALCETLNITKEELFAKDSPILHPFSEINEKGEVKALSSEKAKARLSGYLRERTVRRITKTPPMRKLTLKSIRETIPEVLTAMNEDIKPNTKAVAKTVKETAPANQSNTSYIWKDMGEYFKEVPEFDDPVQGTLGDCYFIAALSSVAWTRPYAISNMAKPSSNGNETSPLHKFMFYKNGKEQSVVTNEYIKTQVSNNNTYYCYARSKDQSEVWPAVIEKAYAKWRTGTSSDYPDMSKIAGGFAPSACTELIGGKITTYVNSKYTAAALMKNIKSHCAGGRTFDPMFASTSGTSITDTEYTNAGIVSGHAYSILGWDSRNGKDYVVLRNPWGSYGAKISNLSGSYSYIENGTTKTIPYNQSGIFALEINSFKKYFYSASAVTDDLFKTKGQ